MSGYTKLVEVSETFEDTYEKEVSVPPTDWFKFPKKTPGQPGVFEVNPVKVVEDAAVQPRFSYWNGVSFGAISISPEGAFRERFNLSSLTAGITAFRGLTEEV